MKVTRGCLSALVLSLSGIIAAKTKQSPSGSSKSDIDLVLRWGTAGPSHALYLKPAALWSAAAGSWSVWSLLYRTKKTEHSLISSHYPIHGCFKEMCGLQLTYFGSEIKYILFLDTAEWWKIIRWDWLEHGLKIRSDYVNVFQRINSTIGLCLIHLSKHCGFKVC